MAVYKSKRVCAVKPSEDICCNWEPLRLTGFSEAHKTVKIPFAVRIDSLISEEVLETALSATLTEFPFLSGRLQEIDGKTFVNNLQEGAVLEIHYAADGLTPPNGDSLESKWVSSGAIPPRISSMDSNGAVNSDDPVCTVRLTKFSSYSVSTIGFAINHALGDKFSNYWFVSRLSYHCDLITNIGSVSSKLPSPTRASFDINEGNLRVSSKEELLHKWDFDLRGRCPLDMPTFSDKETIAQYRSSKIFTVEVRLDKIFIPEFKNNLVALLDIDSQENAWLTSFEAIAAAILVAYSFATGICHESPVNVGLYLNMRKTKAFQERQTYCGNLLTVPRENIPIDSVKLEHSSEHDRLKFIANIAYKLHQICRESLSESKKETIANEFYWHDEAARLGYSKDFYLWFFLNAIQNKCVYINSIAKFDWFTLNFGCKTPVSAFGGAGPLTTPNFLRIIMHKEDVWTVKLAFRKEKDVDKFEQFIHSTSVPFQILRDYVN